MRTTISRDEDFLAVDTDTIRKWCRIDASADEDADGDEDALLAMLVQAATIAAEASTNRSITPATVEFAFQPGRTRYTILTSPILAISKIELEDSSGTRTELSHNDGEYRFHANDTVADLRLSGPANQHVIATLQVGYSLPAEIPAAIKQAIAVHVGAAYDNREGQIEVPPAFGHLLRPYRIEAF